MIPYETFPIHQSIQQERHFLIKTGFNLPYLRDGRMKSTNFEDKFECIEFLMGDIITIKPFKYSVDSVVYTYLVNYYRDDVKIECGYECSMSLDFILINQLVFEDVSNAIKREQRINLILE